MPSSSTLSRRVDTLWLRLCRWGHQRLRPRRPTTPVFVVGCQRSGTSMAMRVFDRSLDAQIYHTGDDRIYDAGLLRSDETIRAALSHSRAAVTVFKPMNQIQCLVRFLETFEGLKVVWLLRGYQDVVNSSVRKWRGMRDTLKSIVDDPRQAGWHGEGLSQCQIDVVREHYHDALSLPSAYALHWYLRNSFFFEQGFSEVSAVRVVRYEDLVADPVRGFSEIFAFCGCPFQPRLTDEVFATSVGKHQPPEIEPAIDSLCRELGGRFDALLGESRSGAVHSGVDPDPQHGGSCRNERIGQSTVDDP